MGWTPPAGHELVIFLNNSGDPEGTPRGMPLAIYRGSDCKRL